MRAGDTTAAVCAKSPGVALLALYIYALCILGQRPRDEKKRRCGHCVWGGARCVVVATVADSGGGPGVFSGAGVNSVGLLWGFGIERSVGCFDLLDCFARRDGCLI